MSGAGEGMVWYWDRDIVGPLCWFEGIELLCSALAGTIDVLYDLSKHSYSSEPSSAIPILPSVRQEYEKAGNCLHPPHSSPFQTGFFS